MLRNALLALALLAGPSCLQATTLQATDTLEHVSIQGHSTLPVKKNYVEFNFDVFYPSEGNNFLQKNIFDWINRQAASYSGIAAIEGDRNISELKGYYEKEFLNRSKKELKEREKEWKKTNNDPMVGVNYLLEIVVKRAYETDKIITYCATGEVYTGGAHGMHYKEYASFRKSDGRLLTWNDLVAPKNQGRFASLIADGVMRYFSTSDFQTLANRLQLEKKPTRTTFPYPAGGPGILAEGIRAQYAYYEIAAYAEGAPFAIVPNTQAQKYLTPLGKGLVNKR